MARAASSAPSRADCFGPVSHRRGIEREDLAVRTFLVETLTGLGADPAARHKLLDNGRQREQRPRFVVRQSLGKVADDVGEDVDAGDVDGAERCALRPADRGTRDRVDLLDREPAGGPGAKDLHHAVQADVIGDEVGRVLRNHHTLAEPMVGERGYRLDHLGIGRGRGDDLEQPQIPRRIEEVGAERVRPEAVGAALDDGRDRNAGSVGADDCVRRADRVDAREQRLLDVEAFDDGFDNPVARRDERRGRCRSRRCGRAPRRRAGRTEPARARGRARDRRARRRRVTSSSSTGRPAFATCAAICAPIVPAPSTATERIGALTNALSVPARRRRNRRWRRPGRRASSGDG